MRAARGRSAGGAALVALALVAPAAASGDPVAVRHWEGLAHGFIGLRTLEGVHLADGELVETTAPTSGGNRVSTRLTLHFADGSLHEERTVYLQRKTFRLVSNHVVQKGPAFKTQLESTISASGRVTVRYTEEDGKEQRLEEHLALPRDVANGMLLAMLKNLSPAAPKTTVSMVAITPKPRLVNLEISPSGEEPFSTGATGRKAMHYVVKVHVPGVTGVVASVLGKLPPDSHVWVLTGEAPAFVKAELPLFKDGPVWRLELLHPVWPKEPSEGKEPRAKEAEEKDSQDGGR
ncbi:hypothetical protein [Anaeromyxobacter diazotrophicus]|uniref:DUF3108 domain-containing protein n=1 Tax=Anaeromyxobacter diazotrophicus TaxID=2590199 RepID=A0A7I9VSD5_9BACT|nr:hypothetical protein [Anaeromyxobacter diazotrophicus]GEJ59128.1 hypothetical protein AMYX_38690 [Anaeromyxobacter diazotrophicus]